MKIRFFNLTRFLFRFLAPLAFAFSILASHGAPDSIHRNTFCQLIVRFFDVLDWVNSFNNNIRIGLKKIEGERQLQKQTVLIWFRADHRSSNQYYHVKCVCVCVFVHAWALLGPPLMPIIIHMISSNLLWSNINLHRHGHVANDSQGIWVLPTDKQYLRQLWTISVMPRALCLNHSVVACVRYAYVMLNAIHNIIRTLACGQWLRRPLTERPSLDTVEPLWTASTSRDELNEMYDIRCN